MGKTNFPAFKELYERLIAENLAIHGDDTQAHKNVNERIRSHLARKALKERTKALKESLKEKRLAARKAAKAKK